MESKKYVNPGMVCMNIYCRVIYKNKWNGIPKIKEEILINIRI